MSFGNKIGELQPSSAPVSLATGPRIPRRDVDTATRTVTPADETNVSAAASMISGVLQTSDVRTEKVEALRQAISNGSYSVPSSQVADSIIKSMVE